MLLRAVLRNRVLWRRITVRLSLVGDGDALSYGYHRHSCRTSVGCGYGSRRRTARCNRRRRTGEFVPSASQASSSAALVRMAKRTCCSPSAGLVHSVSIRSEFLCTRSTPGVCARAEFNSDRRWDDTERSFAMPAKIEISRSRIAVPLANAAGAYSNDTRSALR